MMGEMDQAFIQDPQHTPSRCFFSSLNRVLHHKILTSLISCFFAYKKKKDPQHTLLSIIEDKSIPVIDLSLHHHNAGPDLFSLEGLVKEMGSACKDWGFFQVTNHGVPLSLRQRLEEASRMFFGQSLEDKRKVSRKETTPIGYHEAEHTKNVRNWKEVFDEHDDRVKGWTNPSLDYPPHFRDIIEEYVKEMDKLAFKLMELIALSLGLEVKSFEEFFIKDQASYILFNHYPPCPFPHLALGTGPHKDAGGLTILAQDEVGGLEVKRQTDQLWVRVKPIPDAYIINIGQIIQVWSNDAYDSVEHKVIVNSEKERFSIPFFFFPAHDTKVKPLEELINDKNPSKYRPYKWRKFLKSRLDNQFKKQDVEDLQIYHYKLA